MDFTPNQINLRVLESSGGGGGILWSYRPWLCSKLQPGACLAGLVVPDGTSCPEPLRGSSPLQITVRELCTSVMAGGSSKKVDPMTAGRLDALAAVSGRWQRRHLPSCLRRGRSGRENCSCDAMGGRKAVLHAKQERENTCLVFIPGGHRERTLAGVGVLRKK